MLLFSPPTAGLRRIRVTRFVSVMMATLLTAVLHAQQDHATASSPTLNHAVEGAPTLLRFDSVLSRYQPMTDQKLGSWREANDTVARIGGWRTYLKESQTPDAAAPRAKTDPVAPAAAPPTTNPHAGHGSKP